MYVLGKYPYLVVNKLSEGLVIEREWFITRMDEFISQIPEGIVISGLILAISPSLHFSVTKSFFLGRPKDVDSEIICENIVRNLIGELKDKLSLNFYRLCMF